MAKELPTDTTRILKQLVPVTIKSIVDAVVELVTNCDDSYKRLEEKGQPTSGEIEIRVNRMKGGICKKLIVKDYAEGMNKEEIQKAIVFAGETSGFEAGRSVRGLFGRGLKEAIFALGEGEIRTIKNGKVCRTKLWFDKKYLYDDELLEKEDSSSEKNGTEINISITNEKMKIPEYENFKEQISRHYALRDINQSRKISLIFEDFKRTAKYTTQILFLFPECKKVKVENLRLPRFGDKVKIMIYESPKPLDSPRNNPFGLAGILIKTKGAILDNQLFKFESDPPAFYFFGEAICEGLEERLRKGETAIIDPNRGGLEWRHEYCQILATKIEKVLEPLILEKKKALEKKPEKEVKESTKKLLRNLCNKLNELAKRELEELEVITDIEPDITNLMIKPEVANIQVDKPRIFSIYAPDILVEKEGQEVLIKSDTIDIQPLASSVNLEKHHKYPGKIWYRYFKVVGKRDGAEGNIIAKLGTETVTTKVKVAPQKERKKGELAGRRGGFVSDVKVNELENPPQRVVYKDGVIEIYIKFPSVAKFIKSGLDGVETPEGKILLAELVGDAFCKELAREGIEIGKYPKIPGNEIDSFNTAINDLQKKYLHTIQETILGWKFKE